MSTSKRDDRKLYYHPKRKRFLTYTPIDGVVIEETENWSRRYSKKTYVMPSRKGYKFVGVLK